MNVNKKKRNDYLILIADQALNGTSLLFKDHDKGTIQDSYKGQTAAFPVSIAMSGLLPTLAIYYQDNSGNKTKVNRQAILTVIAKMISLDRDNDLTFVDARALYEGIIRLYESSRKEPDIINKKKINDSIKALKSEIIECSIALKQVVRTYKLEES